MTAPKPPAKQKDWRKATAHNQGSGQLPPKEQEAPSMSRSRIQLATAYAPDTLFTWEGAKGICRSVPISKPAEIKLATRKMIYDGIREAADNWKSRAMTARDDPSTIPMRLVLDGVFYDERTDQVVIDDAEHFKLTRPDVIGYIPFPLLFRCGVCGKLREFESVNQQAAVGLPQSCGDHTARWSQVDVVYVHWSGGLEPLSPFHYNYNAVTRQVDRIDRCGCGSTEFRLHNQAPVFSEWKFICLGCGTPRDLKQADPRTLSILRPRMDAGHSHQWIEINMLPVSYRANSAYYVQKGTFIDFEDRRVVELMTGGQRGELLRSVAHLHGFEYREPPEEKIQQALVDAGKPNEYATWKTMLEAAATIRKLGSDAQADTLQRDADKQRQSWFSAEIVERGSVQSTALALAVHQRDTWARRFDPVRLTIEHETFVREHIRQRLPIGAVDLMDPDPLISDAAGDAAKLDVYRANIRRMYDLLGVAQMTLIRGLPICEYSFGYSRVSATPTYDREYNGTNHRMPVRLNAFPMLPDSQHRPVYVLEQQNEALYIRLDEARVRAWLAANGVTPTPPTGKPGIAGTYLEQYEDFGPFLDAYKGHEGKSASARDFCPYLYMLVHSLSHQFIHALAEMSGLDRDSIGEHIFPADLSFVIYRKGMTPDLGNISAMWRNHSMAFLERVLEPRMLRCGSGSLCDSRGGACPACIMLSDLTCTASNQLLSRSALKGGPPPTWENRTGPLLVGYFDPALRP